MHFHGSYLPEDVTFLLNVKNHKEISIEEKEDLLLNHNVHYSETLTKEMDIEDEYMTIFYNYHKLNKTRIAKDIISITNYLGCKENKVLISLARAGTPYGVILKRMLQKIYLQDVDHYSISIIKERGLDQNAINKIIANYNKDIELIFIDGWTGLGNISLELNKSMLQNFKNIKYQFISITDIAGVSDICSSREDYIIPSSLLNSTISGLISRTLINSAPSAYHSVKYFIEHQQKDISLWYIHELEKEIDSIYDTNIKTEIIPKTNTYRETYIKSLSKIKNEINLGENIILKPGTGETIRCLIRRNPELIIINDKDDPQTVPIIYLCEKKKIKYKIINNLGIKSIGVIKNNKI